RDFPRAWLGALLVHSWVSPSGFRDAAVSQRADAFDGALDDVAGLEEARRLAGGADAGWRTGEDHVAGQKRKDRRELRDQASDAEHHAGGAALLHDLAVDRAANLEVVGARELVRRHQARSDGPEARERLAERELAARGPLHDALGEVLTDRQAGHVAPGGVLSDPVRAHADHDDELDLPIDRPGGKLDVRIRA